MIRVTLDTPWMAADLPVPFRLLSFALWNPGFVTAKRVVWREVRDADLTEDLDALEWFAAQMTARGEEEAIGLITSRDLGKYRLESAESGLSRATCLATVGLTNAERIGHRQMQAGAGFGTINLLAVTDTALSNTALIELLSIAAEARTAAVMEHGPILPAGRATGTGTDCIVVGAPPGDKRFTGLHTDVGEALGAAVYRAVANGVEDWMAEQTP
ncbi:adenosylcobinamide amidohydrolase [Roseibacterium sp. SDUM158016]|uniref:adenosylcobinamide amidohydrolase n=1 Tax=Roseicyclus sediminis TaxID=2980997 RepID=UPI0021CDFE55|nr:adenosylcobinamide amidohydrolase [Roseibacterium sp. SDUM158016]MCU4652230.1 adenosylcobinamide amidohydrolase [Roseibacterium sp. SDUM158016]